VGARTRTGRTDRDEESGGVELHEQQQEWPLPPNQDAGGVPLEMRWPRPRRGNVTASRTAGEGVDATERTVDGGDGGGDGDGDGDGDGGQPEGYDEDDYWPESQSLDWESLPDEELRKYVSKITGTKHAPKVSGDRLQPRPLLVPTA
jgi:hypothetical protein